MGGLSVPPSWATTSPAIRLAATGLPIADLDGLRATGPGNWFGGLPPMGSVVNAPRTGGAGGRSDSRLKVIPQLAAPPNDHEHTSVRSLNVLDSDRAFSERDELGALRRAIGEMAKERDVLMRSASLLIKEAIER